MLGRFLRFITTKIYNPLPSSLPSLMFSLFKEFTSYLTNLVVSNFVITIVLGPKAFCLSDTSKKLLSSSIFLTIIACFKLLKITYIIFIFGGFSWLVSFFHLHVAYTILTICSYIVGAFVIHFLVYAFFIDAVRQILYLVNYFSDWATGLVSLLVLTWLNFAGWISYQVNSLSRFFSQNELLLQDGFIIDFLQKQTLELWLRQYVLSTGSVFSERLVFETITKFFFKYLLWPTKTRVYFEAVSVSDLLLITFYSLLTVLLLSISLFLLF